MTPTRQVALLKILRSEAQQMTHRLRETNVVDRV